MHEILLDTHPHEHVYLLFQILYIRQRLAIKRFPAIDKGVGRRKVAVMRLSRRGGIGRNLSGNFSQIQFPCRMVALCIPRKSVVVPRGISNPVIQHRIQRHLECNVVVFSICALLEKPAFFEIISHVRPFSSGCALWCTPSASAFFSPPAHAKADIL